MEPTTDLLQNHGFKRLESSQIPGEIEAVKFSTMEEAQMWLSRLKTSTAEAMARGFHLDSPQKERSPRAAKHQQHPTLAPLRAVAGTSSHTHSTKIGKPVSFNLNMYVYFSYDYEVVNTGPFKTMLRYYVDITNVTSSLTGLHPAIDWKQTGYSASVHGDRLGYDATIHGVWQAYIWVPYLGSVMLHESANSWGPVKYYGRP